MAATQKIRAFVGDQRIATAVFHGGGILQVFPEKKQFENIAAFKFTFAKANPSVTFQDGNAEIPAPLNPKVQGRIDREMAEFFEAVNTDMIQEAHRVDNQTIRAILRGSPILWEIHRGPNFFVAPRVLKDGQPVHNFDWTPSLTSLKWLLMLAFLEPNT
jgi:hypothetical protein